ncbi:MAG: transketolase [Firmicutes bacterium]|nr:transketolase [Bacillota bacterium]
MEYNDLKKIADKLRLYAVKSVYQAKDGHPGPAMSIADILTVLYFGEMNIDPKNPDWPERDRLILSKGHACPILYAALAELEYFDYSELGKLRKLDGILQGHPDMNKTPGIDMTTGSLGNGVSIGLGMSLASRYKGINNYTYVIIGDGEQQEGIIWESAMAASNFEVGNLIVFADCNHFQSGGTVEEISTLYPLLPKWQSFGWHTQEISGHDMVAIKEAIAHAKLVNDRPSIILCRTIKGKGIYYMENDNSWHKRVPTQEQMDIANQLLGGTTHE